MALPVVAIVGRPNVGKSSLLNRLARRQVSIVDPTAGVTRDRVSTICHWEGRYVELVDTGGMGLRRNDPLADHVDAQIRFAIEQADLILFVVDAREGLTALDEHVAERLRPRSRSVLLVANKVDLPRLEPEAAEFCRLGFEGPVCVSALHGQGREELIAAILQRLDRTVDTPVADPAIRIAIVGKRNAGKSTFVNAVAGSERVIVSEIPGTTRDAIDVRVEKDGRTLLLIDTAGIRRRSRIADTVEFHSYARATRSIRRADVVCLLIDAAVPIARADKALAHYIASRFKPCILVVNKWDLAKGHASSEDYGDYLTRTLPEIDYAPIAFTTARTGRNVLAVIDLASSLVKQARTRINTGRLNAAIQEILALRGPSPRRGEKPIKIYYATQVGVAPPTIVLFVNHPHAIRPDYHKFLLNRLRERLPFPEVPVRLLYRAHHGAIRESVA